MSADEMREILRKRYGIESDQQFWEVFQNQKDLDLSIFIEPFDKAVGGET